MITEFDRANFRNSLLSSYNKAVNWKQTAIFKCIQIEFSFLAVKKLIVYF